MRPLLLLLPLALACGCKRQPPKSAAPSAPSAPLAAPRPIVPHLPSTAPPVDAPKPVVSQIIKVNCEALLGVEHAGRILGTKVAEVDAGKLEPMECRWTGTTSDAMIDAQVMCREGAVRMYRVVDRRIKEGARSVGLGHRSVITEENGQAIVQIVDDKSPCALAVTITPAAKGTEAGRAVFDGLHAAIGH